MTPETFSPALLRQKNRGGLFFVHPDKACVPCEVANDMRALLTLATWALEDDARRRMYDRMLVHGHGAIRPAGTYEEAAAALRDKFQNALDLFDLQRRVPGVRRCTAGRRRKRRE